LVNLKTLRFPSAELKFLIALKHVSNRTALSVLMANRKIAHINTVRIKVTSMKAKQKMKGKNKKMNGKLSDLIVLTLQLMWFKTKMESKKKERKLVRNCAT
jgi:hypothetical protein